MMKQIDMAQMPRKELEKFAMEASGEAERLRAVVEAKEAELRLLRKEKFAGKSEKSRNDNVDEAQLSFFNDAEALARPDAEEPKLEKVKPPRKPKKKGRKKEKLEKLPVKRTEYVLSEEEAVCPQCGSGLAQMKKTVRKEVEIIPAKVVVHEHITQHYVCRECEKKELHTPILQAESPKPLLAGSFLSPSMAAYVIDRKFENRDPVYKISSDFKSHALNLSDQTISNWILRTSEVYGRPLYERMWDHLLKSDYINADETTVQVLVAARAMKMGAETLKPYLTGAGIESKGTVVIGTAAGDLHDIGKNLVRMMMESKGFEVIDLGVDPEEYEGKLRMMIICSGPLEQLHTMMGFDEGLMATILEPEACKEFFEAIIDYKIEMLEGILEYYPLDIVEQHDDYGHNNNSFISLDQFRELLMPA